MKRQFDLISDTIARDGPWIVLLLQVIYVISWWKTKKRYSFFYARVSNLANEDRGCKKTYARKAGARFKLDERGSNIAISLRRSLVFEREGHIEIFCHFFPSLLSRFAPLNLITRDADSGGSNSAVTTCCPGGQLRSRAKLRSSRGFYYVALLTRPREHATRRELITLLAPNLFRFNNTIKMQ